MSKKTRANRYKGLTERQLLQDIVNDLRGRPGFRYDKPEMLDELSRVPKNLLPDYTDKWEKKLQERFTQRMQDTRPVLVDFLLVAAVVGVVSVATPLNLLMVAPIVVFGAISMSLSRKYFAPRVAQMKAMAAVTETLLLK